MFTGDVHTVKLVLLVKGVALDDMMVLLLASLVEQEHVVQVSSSVLSSNVGLRYSVVSATIDNELEFLSKPDADCDFEMIVSFIKVTLELFAPGAL